MKNTRIGCGGMLFSGILAIILLPFTFFFGLLKEFPKFRKSVLIFITLTVVFGLIAAAVEELSNKQFEAPAVLITLLMLSACVFCGIKVYVHIKYRHNSFSTSPPRTNQQPEPLTLQHTSPEYRAAEDELLIVDLMEGHAFEYWCADALRNCGFSDVSVTPGSGDQGVDVLAIKDGIKYAIQCKCYSSNLGNTPIQEVAAGKSFYHCHVGAVMTNQYFTPKAKELADATGTLLWDRDWIKAYIESKAASNDQQCINRATSAPAEVSVGHDEMLPAAVDVILETGQASVSMIQRRLKLGYARAARLIDEMEALGIVSPFQGSAPREILVTRGRWLEIKSKLY